MSVQMWLVLWCIFVVVASNCLSGFAAPGLKLLL